VQYGVHGPSLFGWAIRGRFGWPEDTRLVSAGGGNGALVLLPRFVESAGGPVAPSAQVKPIGGIGYRMDLPLFRVGSGFGGSLPAPTLFLTVLETLS